MTVSAEAAWPPNVRTGTPTRARDGVVDTMRGIAILMVIGIHSLPKADGAAYITAIDAALRPCVPIFLFVSGYLTAQSGAVPLAKRLRRALGPYTVAFIAAYVLMAVDNPAMDHRPAVAVGRYVFAFVFVYYYVFVYVGCTVMLWAAVVLAGEGRQRTQRLALLLMLTIVAGLACGAYLDPLLHRLGVSESLIEEARLRDLPFWFAFMAIGGLAGLFRAGDLFRAWRYSLAGAVVAAYAIYAAVRIAGIGDAAAYDSLVFFLYAALLCVTLVGFAPDNAALALLGSASYFIYLWHIFVIVVLRQIPALQAQPLLASIVEYAAALSVSAALVLLLRRLMPPRIVHGLGA
jgi:peptidoglycan/LPS O-acetylase OafA/YrhL